MKTDIDAINKTIEAKIASVKRRTADDSADTIRMRLAISELNYDQVIDQRDYLLDKEWTPLVKELQEEVTEALRLSSRIDYITCKRVREILGFVLGQLGAKVTPAAPAVEQTEQSSTGQTSKP